MIKSLTGDIAWLKSDITRDNNFDLIRLLAALEVVLLHSAGHMSVPVPTSFFNFLGYFQGVPIFFFLSGILVTSSLSSSRSISAFYMKRVRRVFPALWLSFAISVMVLIAFHQLTTSQLKLPTFWFWVVTQISFLQFYNPEFFRHFGTGVVNGALWTISVEIGFYLALPFIAGAAGRLGASRRNPRLVLECILIPGVVLSYVLSRYIAATGDFNGLLAPKPPLWALLVNQTFLPHFWFFGLGILAYLRYDTLKAHLPGWPVLLPLYMIASFLGDHFDLIKFPGFLLFSRMLLCATVLAFGAFSRPVAARILRGWDLSYSLYVFHMLVLNTFFVLGYQGSWRFVFLVTGVSLACAAVSWKFIERPALQRRGPSAGFPRKGLHPQEAMAPPQVTGAMAGESTSFSG